MKGFNWRSSFANANKTVLKSGSCVFSIMWGSERMLSLPPAIWWKKWSLQNEWNVNHVIFTLWADRTLPASCHRWTPRFTSASPQSETQTWKCQHKRRSVVSAGGSRYLRFTRNHLQWQGVHHLWTEMNVYLWSSALIPCFSTSVSKLNQQHETHLTAFGWYPGIQIWLWSKVNHKVTG